MSGALTRAGAPIPVTLDLRANWRQFALLVLVNAFVGALVGLERSVLPLMADQEFAVASKQAMLAFIATFGLAKAGANLLAGRWGDRFGRRRVLILGWLLGWASPAAGPGAARAVTAARAGSAATGARALRVVAAAAFAVGHRWLSETG